MNPETKLTDEQIQEICARHGIPYISHSRITTGFSHEVHRLNNDLLIKLFNARQPRNFETELALLKSDLDFPKPKLVASYQSTDGQGRSYIVMSFVPGIPLGSKWHEATDEQRESLIKDISKTLTTINCLNPEMLEQPSGTWPSLIEQRIFELLNKLRVKNTITELQAEKISATFANGKEYLNESRLYPVYWDIHFDNFLVNEQFELQAIIDLENVEFASLDYPLFVVEKLIDEPYKYLREEDEKYADVKDYAKLKEWYKEYYPQMFAFESLEKRVRLYLIIDTLHLLVNWSHDNKLYEKLEGLIRDSYPA